MTILRHEFHPQADKPAKYPSPFSLRLTYAEKAQLLAEAGRKPLGVYIRRGRSLVSLSHHPWIILPRALLPASIREGVSFPHPPIRLNPNPNHQAFPGR
jgi:hypothetical protein